MPLVRLLPIIGLIALAGCSSTQTATQYSQPIVTAAPVQTAVPVSTNPAQENAAAMAMTDVGGFIDPTAAGQLSSNSRTQALAAVYNSLNFGRPGAPRSWQGDSGQSGKVVVGPYVPVNALQCRSFTHDVVVSGQTFSKKGMACREPDRTWSVESTG